MAMPNPGLPKGSNRWLSCSLGIQTPHRTSDDEQGVYNHILIKVFRFHETILSRWARIPRGWKREMKFVRETLQIHWTSGNLREMLNFAVRKKRLNGLSCWKMAWKKGREAKWDHVARLNTELLSLEFLLGPGIQNNRFRTTWGDNLGVFENQSNLPPWPWNTSEFWWNLYHNWIGWK